MLLVDGDEQGTAAAFTDLRAGALGAPGYTAVILQGAALRTQVRQLAPKYDDVAIEVGGRDTGSPGNNRLRNHMLHDRPHHLAQRRITYLLRRASGDLFLGPYGVPLIQFRKS